MEDGFLTTPKKFPSCSVLFCDRVGMNLHLSRATQRGSATRRGYRESGAVFQVLTLSILMGCNGRILSFTGTFSYASGRDINNENKWGFGEESQKTHHSLESGICSVDHSGRKCGFSHCESSATKAENARRAQRRRRRNSPAKDGVLCVEMRLLRVCTSEEAFVQLHALSSESMREAVRLCSTRFVTYR